MPSSPQEIHRHRLGQLALFVRERDQILADWDAYRDQHTHLDGLPHDVGHYVRRAGRRDADIWRAFNRVRPGAKDLVATAETQLQRLPAQAIQSRWAWQLGVLGTALDQLAVLQKEWLAIRDILHPSARPGTTQYEEERFYRNAEAGHYLDEWATHGYALHDINSAALHCSSPLAPPPTMTAVPAPGRTAPVRR
ncbi:hypothetical protein QOM21_08080 [Streptomyces sp. Pv4-95]|uniref:hypothetical protein n=1 Tax=Streptomyces sp. Pv4-95 TaxID=3049543 RepID=UPI00389180DF